MADANKESLKEFGKVILIFLAGMIGIITAAGVWNGNVLGLDGFYGWVAGLNLILEGFGIYSLYKYLFKKPVVVESKKEVKTKKKLQSV